MSGPTGQHGLGPELMGLMRQSPNSGAGSPMQQNSQTLPPQAPQTQAIPQAMANNVQGGMPGQPVQGGELGIALNALAQYVKSHGNVHEADGNVHIKKAQAAAITAQHAPQQGGQ